MSSRHGKRMLGSVLFVCAVANALQAEDKVTLVRNNEVLMGRVKKEDAEQIEMEVREKTGQTGVRKLSPSDITDIEWDINDAEWREGYRHFKRGSYGKAAQSFNSIIGDKESLDKIRPEAKPYLFFMYAESLYRSGNAKEAVPAFEKCINEFTSSFYSSYAVGSLVDAAIQNNDFTKVPPLLSKLRALSGEPKAMADYYEGKMWKAQKKSKDARNKFLAAERGSSVPATKGMALMGQASCALEEGNLVEARDLAQKALASGNIPSVAGAAHLIIGNAMVAEADSAKLMGEALEFKLLDALLEFMRVHMQYAGDRNTEPEAMLRAGDCLQRLAKAFPKTRGADRHRAIAMYSRLKEDPRYRGTSWSEAAGEAMKNFR